MSDSFQSTPQERFSREQLDLAYDHFLAENEYAKHHMESHGWGRESWHRAIEWWESEHSMHVLVPVDEYDKMKAVLSERGETDKAREVMLALARALSTIRYEITGALANYLSPDAGTKQSLIRIECCARDALETLKNAAPGKGAGAIHDSPATPVGTPALRAAGTASVAAPTSEIGRSHAQAAPESVTGTLSSNTLEKLLQTARNLKMSPKQVYDQRVSFIYGNQPEESTVTIEQVKQRLAEQGIVDPATVRDVSSDKGYLSLVKTLRDSDSVGRALPLDMAANAIEELLRELAEADARCERMLDVEQNRLLLASEDEIRREILADGRDPAEYLKAVDKVMKLTGENALLKHDLQKALANHSADLSARRELEEKPVAWLIERPKGTGQQQTIEYELVLSPLTDDTFMDEGDEAWPLYKQSYVGEKSNG